MAKNKDCFVDPNPPYDPFDEPQSPGKRRDIRKSLREILNETTCKSAELVQGSTDALSSTLANANNIFENVRQCREAALDAQVVSAIAQLGKQKVQQLDTDLVQFNSMEFAQKLMTFVSRENLQPGVDARMTGDAWVKLGAAVQTFFKRSPPLHYMLGTLEIKKRERKVGDRQAKEKENIASVQPKELKSFKDGQQKEATSEEVEAIHNILTDYYNKCDRQPICYFEFVVNPHSFGQTVENMFYTSFLIRDEHARLFLDEDGLPVIEPKLDKKEGGDNGSSNHVVMSLDMEEWREIIDAFKITQPLIPTRPDPPNSPHSGPSSSGSCLPNRGRAHSSNAASHNGAFNGDAGSDSDSDVEPLPKKQGRR